MVRRTKSNRKLRAGHVITTGEGANCFMGTITRISGDWAWVKYVDFVNEFRVHSSLITIVGVE